MRRQLFAMLHVNEFSKEAVWRDPCHSIVLEDVTCAACGAVADLDVCRDAATVATGDVWRCRCCTEPFEHNAIEQRLLTRVAAAVCGYQLQDLVCARCGSVSVGGMRTQCEGCGESLKLTVTEASVQRELSVLWSIAHFHGMQLLAEAAKAAAAVAR
jgi:DNA polymerase epsilon subunit 1